MTDKQLLELKRQIENSEKEISKKEGQLELLKKELKEEYNCESIAEAEELLQKKDKEILKLETTINEKIEELEDLYDFES